jgi:nitrogen fixation/metabolism regulation signal transduction histidine kinase
VVRLCHLHDDPQPLTLAATMVGPVRTVRKEDLLHDAVKLMAEVHIRRVAVVDGDGAVCGVLTHHEIVGGLEGDYVTYLKDMIQRQEKVLISRQAAVNAKELLENILRSAVGTAVVATDLECRIVHCNPAAAAIPKLRHFGSPGEDARDILARMGWSDGGKVLTPDALRNGRLHSEALAWNEGDDRLRVELQVSLLIDDRNQPQGYLLLAR